MNTEQRIVTKADYREHPVLRGQPVYFTRAHPKRVNRPHITC
jgi:hypothetical protein